MKIEQLRFRPISHLAEADVDVIFQNVNKNVQTNITHQIQKQREERGYQMIHNGFPQEPFNESLFYAFVGETNKETNLKQECIKLKFEKIALEDLARRLQQQNVKKDELIRSLKDQLRMNGIGGKNNGEQYL